MTRNVYRVFQELFPDPPLQTGTVAAVSGDIVRVTLPGGGVIQARGVATVGQRVFVRDGVIEGEAPALTVISIEV